MDPVTGGRAELHELRNLSRAPWGDVGNSTLHWCTYLGQQYLFKQYSTEFCAEVDNQALDGLIAWRDRLAQEDRERLDRVAAWPRFQVRDHGALVGVLVPPAPDGFYGRFMSGGPRPRSMDYLIRFDTGEGEAKGAPLRDKRRAIGNAAAVLLWFHRHGVRVNDLRESNILCTADGTAVYYVDCDVMMGPWGVVSPGAAPEYLAAVLRHKPDPFEKPSREMELARVAWLATFIILNDFRLRDVPADRLARHVGAGEADLLRRTARMHAFDIEDWRALARHWTENPWVGHARVQTGLAAGRDQAQRNQHRSEHWSEHEEPPVTVADTYRLPRTRVMPRDFGPRRPYQWLPDHLRQPPPVQAPLRSYLQPDDLAPVTPPARASRRLVLVTLAAVVVVFGLLAALTLPGGA